MIKLHCSNKQTAQTPDEQIRTLEHLVAAQETNQKGQLELNEAVNHNAKAVEHNAQAAKLTAENIKEREKNFKAATDRLNNLTDHMLKKTARDDRTQFLKMATNPKLILPQI